MDLSPLDWKSFRLPLIAVDEVGRGCLAGPVVAAAVYVDSLAFCFDPSITDSKKLTAKKREQLAKGLKESCRTAIGFATPQEIDEINIFQASFLAMKRAIANLGVAQGLVLVDGKFKIPNLPGFEQIAIIKGDLRVQPIGAASILAKVYRDHEMTGLAEKYPGYGFEIHKGYATKVHKEAIQKRGCLVVHRKSFRGVLPEIGSPH